MKGGGLLNGFLSEYCGGGGWDEAADAAAPVPTTSGSGAIILVDVINHQG